MTERPISQHLRASGGFRDLRSFHVATIIYDATVQFCNHFLDKRSRLVDQMTQAARSGRQNIESGLIKVARASLEELLLNYEDFLRQRKIRQWGKDDLEAQAVRAVASRNKSDQSDYSIWLQSTSPGAVANAIICLIHQANSLLDQQIRSLEQDQSAPSEKSLPELSPAQSVVIPGAPSCPKCGKPMALRIARSGRRPGSQFWGCVTYPKCNGLRNLDPA